MIRAAILDVDGTLLDSMPIWENAGAIYLEGMGIQAPKNLGQILCEMSLEEGAEYIRKHFVRAESLPEVKQGILCVIRDFYRLKVQPKNSVLERVFLYEKQGIPMILATTGDRELVESALERLHLRQYFADVLCADDYHCDKTQPTLYLQAARILGEEPNYTAVYEDALYALKTAKTAGFYTVAVWDEANQKDWQIIQTLADERIGE